MKKKTLLLIGLALGAAYFLTKKSSSAAPAPPAPASTSLPGAITSAVDDALKLGTTIATEMKGIDGMIPDSLHGHMASLGAYGELGSFHGGGW